MCQVKHAARIKASLAGVAQLVAASSYAPEAWGFDSPSGNIPRL